MCVKFSRICSRTQNCPSVQMDEIHHDLTAVCMSMWSAHACHHVTELGKGGWFDYLISLGFQEVEFLNFREFSGVFFREVGLGEGMVGRHSRIQSCSLYNCNILPLAKFISRHFGSIFERYSSFNSLYNHLYKYSKLWGGLGWKRTLKIIKFQSPCCGQEDLSQSCSELQPDLEHFQE